MRSLLCVSLCALLAACSGSSEPPANPAPLRQVRVDWLGYETFRMTSSLGLKIVTNPFGSSVGSLPGNLRADVLLITTEKSAFNNSDAIENTPTTFRGPIGAGLHSSSGIAFRGVPTADPRSGDVNLAFTWTVDGIRICFAGNQAAPFSGYDLGLIGTVDVLFLPVGVPSSLSDDIRAQIIGQLRPRVIIPMGPSGAVNAWAAAQPNLHRVNGSSVFLSREKMPFQQTVLLLESRS